MHLSLLSFFQPPAMLAPVVQLADELGFRRFWIGEHHSSLQCPNPLLVCSAFAGVTQRMRLGTGAVLLHRRKPYNVAQDARILTQLYGDRFDFGVTGASYLGPHGWHWHPSDEIHGDDQLSAIELLHHYLIGRPPETADARAVKSLAWTDVTPRLWLLGTSVTGAKLAGRLGLGYCTSHHHEESLQVLRECIATYRDSFKVGSFAEPSVIAVRSGVCATHRTMVEQLAAQVRTTSADPSLGRFAHNDLLTGLPDQIALELEDFGERVGADEVMFLPLNYHCPVDESLATLEALANVVGLHADPI